MMDTNVIKKQENSYYRQRMACRQGLTGVYMKYRWVEITKEEFEEVSKEESSSVYELHEDRQGLTRI